MVAATPDAGPGKLTTDPDLNRQPPPKLLAIDWSTVALTSEADALALWKRIAPTGEDWEAKLDEIPGDGPIASQLALALLHGGNFTCVPAQPRRDCSRVPLDVEPPLPAATLDDPCLRRMLALWSLGSLDDTDVPAARDALRAIAAIPPPESQLVAAAIDALPVDDQDGRLELRGIAFAAGQRELVNGKLGDFDVAHLTTAIQKHHIDGALDILSAEAHRPVYLAAVTDENLFGPARAQGMVELAATVDGPKLPRDLRTALVAATRSKDCGVVAAAARVLVKHGERTYGPARPHARTTPPMMRAMCVLASFEALQQPDEPSYLLGYVPARGLELLQIAYDPYSDDDADGDGDPHTIRTLTQLPRDQLTLPELDDMIRSFASCSGTTCKSDDHEFRFVFKPGTGGELMLQRLEVVERPPCTIK